ncbi:hypothetical protein [Chromobacterium haemolyticum]
MVEVPLERLEELERDAHMLLCLQGAGVDNWCGYEYAIEAYLEEYPDD